MIVKPFSQLHSCIYTNDVAQFIGTCGHASIRGAEFFGLQLLQSCEKIQSLFGWKLPEEEFRESIQSPPPPSLQTAFMINIDQEKTFIQQLEQQGVIDESVSVVKTAIIVVQIVGTILFVVATCPISIALALSGLVMRCVVQNQMHPLTKLVPDLSAQKTVWDGKTPLSICTLNVALTEFEIMDWINGVSSTHVRAPETAQFLSQCGADVICLQEAFDVDTIYPTIAQTLRDQGYYVVMTSKRQEVFGMTGGLLVASKYPIQDVGFEEYSDRVGIDARTKKGVLATTLTLNDSSTICVAATHMQAGYPGSSEQEHIQGRIKQFGQARRFIDAFCDQKGISDIFFVGDYNIGRFGSLEINQSTFKEDYEGQVRGLLEPKDADLGYKDLTVPDTVYSFADSLAHQSHFPKNDATSQETGIEKGTSFDTNATSYIYLNDLRKIYPDVAPQCYIKPNVCDHVAFKHQPNTLFDETGYTYEVLYPIGQSGFLSDHVAVKVTLQSKKTS